MKPCLSTVLVHTPCRELEDDQLEPPMGLLYIASWLKVHGCPVHIVDLSCVADPDDLSTVPKADIYGFSCLTATYASTCAIARAIKNKYPRACTVAGGPHATALPHAVANHFDFTVTGEGEKAMLRIVSALTTRRALPRVLEGVVIRDLDCLPFPDYALVDVHTYTRTVDSRPSISILTSRGCPYRCRFCNSVVMNKSADSLRFRSPANVVEEVQTLREAYGTTAFRIQDDTFTLNLPRLRKLNELFRREKITYRCFGRVDQCTRELTDMLYEGGCRHIAFGVESGAPEILKGMAKQQTVEQIRAGIANAKASGLIVRVFLLVGFPGETRNTVEATVDLMRECAPHEFSVYPLIPYPGTPLFHEPAQFGITHIDPDFSKYFQVRRGREAGYVFRTADLDEATIREMREYVIESLEPAVRWAGDSVAYK